MWIPYDSGHSIGQTGSEQGVILLDEECTMGARITLEEKRPGTLYSITCGIYGYMVHTVFGRELAESQARYQAMKDDIGGFLQGLPCDASENDVSILGPWMENFIERFDQ